MNVYQKIQSAKVKLQELNLKKTGNNKFAGYTYFELGDFLPSLNKIMAEIGLTSCVSFDSENASLTIYNAENPEEFVVYTSPMRSASLKGAHEIQNLGAVQTYERRYLYMAAFDIVESDVLDATQGNDPKTESKKFEHKCATCGKTIKGYIKKDGTAASPEDIINKSMAMYGQPMCAECFAKKYKEDKEIK